MLQRAWHSYISAFAGLTRETWLLSFVLLINRAGTMAVPFMTMYATQHLQWSLRSAGLLVTLYGVGSIMGASLGGFLVDKLGFRRVQIVASISAGILFMLFPLVTHFTALCLLTTMLALVAEAFRPANFTAIAAYAAPDKLIRSNSLNRLAINIGWALGVAMGGIIAHSNYPLLFWVDGAGNILAGLLIWRLLPPLEKSAAAKAQSSERPAVVRKPWQDGYFMRFIFFVVIFNTCFFLVFRLVPVFWKTQWGLDERTIGLVLGLNGVLIALFEMVLVKRWEGKRPPMVYIIAGSLLGAVGYSLLLLPGFGPLLLAVAHMAVLTLAEMLALPFMNAIIINRSNPWNRGQYAAGYTLSWSAAQVIGPAAGAWIADVAGYRSLWLVLTAVSLLAAAGFRWVSRQSPES